MKLLLMLPYAYDVAPSQRYRWEQWEPYLNAQGIDTERLHFMTPRLNRLREQRQWLVLALSLLARYALYLAQLVCAVKRCDCVVVHRNAALAGPPVIETLLRLLRKPFIYDFDDAIYLAPPRGDNPLRRLLRCDWRAVYLCRHAARVSVGNETLAAFARQYNETVSIWRTSIDTNHYQPKTHNDDGVPVVGWTGSPSTASYISALLPMLRALQQTHDFELLIVGVRIDLQGIRGECVPWSSATEVAMVQRMDIGLMPLDDTPWEAGKCSLKSLQYQAAGVPAVVSDVGMNRLAVKDGETGLLVAPGGDWAEPIGRLLNDAALRRRMGEAARAHVVQHFSAQVVAKHIAEELRS